MPTLSEYDRQRLARLLRLQYNVVARSQALECGLTRGAITHRLRPGGPWHQVLPGVYLAMTGTATADQRDIAALLYAGPQSVITGPVAVRRHNIRCAGLNVLDVLVPADTRQGLRGDHRAPQPDGSRRDPRAALAAQHDPGRAASGPR
jgi:hypothetical protein